MSYLGENKYFSFRDNYCEAIPNSGINSSAIAEFGRIISCFFKRFSVGSCELTHKHILYALCSGISECGGEIFICENTELPSFKFGLSLLSAECGIFISGNGCIKLSFYNSNGFPISSEILSGIINSSPAHVSNKSGKIMPLMSFRDVYISNLLVNCNSDNIISASISCGNHSIRSLWKNFFSGEDDSLVLQISDDGQKVNVYSSEAGFISYEKLIFAYSIKLANNGQEVYLPDNFHYGIDFNKSQPKIKRFSVDRNIPDEAINQRFLTDPLYMCINLMKNKKDFLEIIKSLPQLATAKREITINNFKNIPRNKVVLENNGKIIISRNGKNRISLIAQAYSSETASELCSLWSDKLRCLELSDNA